MMETSFKNMIQIPLCLFLNAHYGKHGNDLKVLETQQNTCLPTYLPTSWRMVL